MIELRQEHWTHALQQPSVAVATLLGASAVPARPTPPYFWSDQYGARLQFAGHRRPDDEVEIVEGDLGSRRFVAGYQLGKYWCLVANTKPGAPLGSILSLFSAARFCGKYGRGWQYVYWR